MLCDVNKGVAYKWMRNLLYTQNVKMFFQVSRIREALAGIGEDECTWQFRPDGGRNFKRNISGYARGHILCSKIFLYPCGHGVIVILLDPLNAFATP